jgi:hypothetical protein
MLTGFPVGLPDIREWNWNSSSSSSSSKEALRKADSDEASTAAKRTQQSKKGCNRLAGRCGWAMEDTMT